VAWPIPGHNLLHFNKTNGTAAQYPVSLIGVSDTFRRFFECRCTPWTALPGFGGHGWNCILNMVLITGVLDRACRKISSSAFAEGLKEGMGSDGASYRE
jgi:hypothetical protein